MQQKQAELAIWHLGGIALFQESAEQAVRAALWEQVRVLLLPEEKRQEAERRLSSGPPYPPRDGILAPLAEWPKEVIQEVTALWRNMQEEYLKGIERTN